jgi:O-antigen ligase
MNLPLQRMPAAVAIPAAAVTLLAAMRPTAAAVMLLAAMPLLPILGTRLHGPWIAPAELALLAGAAGGLAARPADERPHDPLVSPLILAALAALVGGIAATLAALPVGLLPGALRDLTRNFFKLDAGHAAAPIHAALVHATALLGFLALRRAAARYGAPAVLRASLAGGSLVGLYAVVEAAGGLKLWPPELYDTTSQMKRVISTLSDCNSAGAYFSLLLFPAAGMAFAARGAKQLAGLALTSLFLVGLFLSGSRTAWIGAVVAGGLFLAMAAAGLRRRHPARLLPLLAGVAVVALLVAMLIAFFPGLTGSILRERLASLGDPAAVRHALTAGRVRFWQAGVAMLAAHPLAGVGPGRVPARFSEYRPEDLPVEAENVHDYPLQCLDENGIAGGAVLLLPFAMLVPRLVREGRRAADGDGAASGLAFGLVAFLFCGLTSHPWLLPEMQFVFWGHAALVPPPPPADAAARGRRSLPVVVAAAVLATWGLPRLLLSPGREAGSYGYGSWSPREGPNGVRWLGPEALVNVARPDGSGPFLLHLKASVDAPLPITVAARVEGGPWTSATLPPETWTDLVVMPPAQTGGGPVACEIRSSFSFCPATTAGDDRRILSVQADSPFLGVPR